MNIIQSAAFCLICASLVSCGAPTADLHTETDPSAAPQTERSLGNFARRLDRPFDERAADVELPEYAETDMNTDGAFSLIRVHLSDHDRYREHLEAVLADDPAAFIGDKAPDIRTGEFVRLNAAGRQVAHAGFYQQLHTMCASVNIVAPSLDWADRSVAEQQAKRHIEHALERSPDPEDQALRMPAQDVYALHMAYIEAIHIMIEEDAPELGFFLDTLQSCPTAFPLKAIPLPGQDRIRTRSNSIPADQLPGVPIRSPG